MRCLFRLLPAFLAALAVAAPVKAHVAGPILSAPAQAAGVTLAGLPPTPHPACQRHIFTAGQYPTTPQTVEQITCLDTLCDTREVVLCPLTD